MTPLPRLLMLTHRFPYPPNRGDRIRSYHLLRVLAREFRVTLGATTDEPISDSNRKHVQGLCQQVVIGRPGKVKRSLAAANSVLRRKSLTEGMFSSVSLQKQIHQLHLNNPFDAALIFCSSMFPYVDSLAFQGVRRVVDLVDVDSCKWQQMSCETRFPKRQIFLRESQKVRELEQRIADVADAVTLVSDDEAALYKRTINGSNSLTVVGVSNGVDSEYFDPMFAGNETPNRLTQTQEMDPAHALVDERLNSSKDPRVPSGDNKPLRLVFTGVLDYHPNVSGLDWFCRQVLPELQKQVAVDLQIVGRSPNAPALALDKLDGVTVIGPVPDVRPYLAAADIAISPLKLARGIQNKVLEAMAMGRPVVCTSPSAEGIAGVDGIHFVIADSVDDWCAALAQLHLEPNRQKVLSAAARQLVVDAYSWPAKLRPMLELLRPNSKFATAAAVSQNIEAGSNLASREGSSAL